MPRHTEEEIVARKGPALVLGGVRKDVPALVIEDNEAWQAALGERVAAEIGGIQDGASWTDILALVSSSIPLMIDLVVAYDKDGHAGGAEWIRKHATAEEVYDAFKEVVAASYPFAKDLAKFPTLLSQVLSRASASSTSSPSPSGASLPTPSAAG